MTFEQWWQKFREDYPQVASGEFADITLVAHSAWVAGKGEGLKEMRDLALQTMSKH